jgi:anti-sigma factor RsiW
MKCKHARRAVVLDHYKELDPAEKARLEAHLLACEACAADREETKSVLDLVSAHGRAEVPAFDAEKAWRAVRKEIGGPAPVRAHSLPAWRRFAPAAAGAGGRHPDRPLRHQERPRVRTGADRGRRNGHPRHRRSAFRLAGGFGAARPGFLPR